MSEAVREHMGDALEELSIQVERWKHQIGSCLLHSSLCQSLGWQSEDRLYHALHQINRTTISRHRHSSDSSMQEGAYNCVMSMVSDTRWTQVLRLGQALLLAPESESLKGKDRYLMITASSFPKVSPTLQKRKDGPRLGSLVVWPFGQRCWE